VSGANAGRRGLGRGLSSLIPDSVFEGETAATTPSAPWRTVPIDEIRPNPEQPRRRFAAEELQELAASIGRHGVLSPLVVRREEGRYILIAGERRLRAAALAGVHEVPVVVREAQEGADQLELALVENLQREDLDAIEAARGYQRLCDQYNYTQDEVATRVGKSRVTVTNALRLLRLPDFVLAAVQDGRVSAGHARALLPLTDDDELRRLLGRVIAQQLSVRDTERLVAALTRGTQTIRADERDKRERTYAYANRILSEALHTSVAVKPRSDGTGRIVIDYAGAEDLERLISKLRA
jgi:ParB family chromosome partitioning protein